jgi:hypothetical protein
MFRYTYAAVTAATPPQQRGVVDQQAVALPAKALDTGSVHIAEEIYVNNRLKDIRRHLVKSSECAHGGVVDPHINPPEVPYRPIRQLTDCRLGCRVYQ